MKHQLSDNGKVYLYVGDRFESQYQLLVNAREKLGSKDLKNPKAIIDYSQTLDDIYENLEYYSLTKKIFNSALLYDIRYGS